MSKFLSGLISAIGLFLLFGSIGGLEAGTMFLPVGAPLAFAGAVFTWFGLSLLDADGVQVWE